jgi:hypothetical protein
LLEVVQQQQHLLVFENRFERHEGSLTIHVADTQRLGDDRHDLFGIIHYGEWHQKDVKSSVMVPVGRSGMPNLLMLHHTLFLAGLGNFGTDLFR